MLSKLLTVVFIVSLVGCESKEYKKSDNSSVEIVKELNQGESESVIQKLSAREDLSPRERYYLASALSQKGGIDVYSLYSILEMQLFRKNALEWSDLSKEKNPYLKFMKSQEGVDFEKRRKKREERWNKYLPKILEKHQIKLEKPTMDNILEDYPDATEENYLKADAAYVLEKDKILKLPPDIEHRMEEWTKIFEVSMKGDYRYFNLLNYYSDVIYLETLKENYLDPEKKPSQFGGIRWEMLYMNILWNTYEAIPLMKQLPDLNSKQQESVTAALEHYKLLVEDKEFGPVAVKNIIVLAGISLMSIYKESFDLEEINSIQDLMCSFEPQGITENYGIIRKRVLFLAEVVDQKGGIPELAAHKEKIEEFKKSLPEELTDDQKANYLNGVEKFRLDTCFNG